MEKPQPTVLYISGLGDHYDGFRRVALYWWRLWGVRAVLVPMNWYGTETLEGKQKRLLSEIEKHDRVILIGESAGAAVALQPSTGKHKNIERVVTICGVASPATPIASTISKRAPVLLQATRLIPRHVPASTICFRALCDPVLSVRYTHIPGADNQVVYSVGHFFTISLCLTLYAPWVIRRITK